MTAYAVANLRAVRMGPAVVAYLEQIDATLRPFGGRFLVHGGPKDVLEGQWPDDLVVLAFADLDTARAWYRSEAYQGILSLRRDNAHGDVILIDGVGIEHRATDILDAERRSASLVPA